MKLIRAALARLRSFALDHPADSLGLAAFAVFLAGVALLSVPWSMIAGGGLVFLILGVARVLGWDGELPPPPEGTES